ncbi:MAG: hypothetical protein WA771_14935, partial [Chthoniobacterales bacterium]
STQLLRHYVENYQNAQDLIPYVTGSFNILDSYELSSDDFINSGVVALAQDTENPQVLIEHIFPAEERMVPALHRSLLTGLDIPIQKTRDLTAITHVSRLDDGRLKFTVVPIHYPSYASTEGPGSFSLDPPTSLNVETGLPVLAKPKIAEADTRYATYRQKAGLDPAPGTPRGEAPAPANSLVRVQAATDLAGETPEPAPVEVAPTTEVASVEPPTPAPDDAPESDTPIAPAPTPASSPIAAASPPPTPRAAAPTVPLKPFNSDAKPPAVANTAAGGWPVYPAGQMPRGKLVDVRSTTDLAGQTMPADRMYLQGDFVVTASGTNRAVLRPSSGRLNSTTRLIVDFPQGSRLPDEGNRVARDGKRPFLITDVKKTADGTVNIYVREITQE